MKIMKIYRRYLIREAAADILLVLVAFLALFAFFDMFNEMRDVGRDGYKLHHAAAYVALRMPGRMYELMPIAVLIGTLYALSSLARHSEITVLRVSGISTTQLLLSLFQIALLFAAITFLFGEYVAPPAEKAAQALRIRVRADLIAQEFRSGLWVKDENTFINIGAVTPDARLEQIRIFNFDDRFRLREVRSAAKGTYQPPNSWQLTDIFSITLSDDENHASATHTPEASWQSALNPDILSVLMVVPERMSLSHLITYLNHLRENKQNTQRYEIAFWKKFIYPLAALVMVALALPFGFTYNRVSGVSLKIFTGVMIGILFYLLNGLFSNLSVIYSWPPIASVIAPSALFLIAAIALITWIERR